MQYKVDRCKVCKGSGGEHERFFTLRGERLPLGNCSECQGDGWTFADHNKFEFVGTYPECSRWARSRPTAEA